MISQTDLHTERLLLRPFRAGDVDDALAYRNDREFSRYLSHIPQPFERHHAEAFVALNMSESWATSPTFGIEFAGKLIGTVNHEVDPPVHTAMLGYAIALAEAGAVGRCEHVQRLRVTTCRGAAGRLGGLHQSDGLSAARARRGRVRRQPFLQLARVSALSFSGRAIHGSAGRDPR